MTDRIYHGDCLDIIKNIPDKSIDLVLSDPPYGIGLDDWDVLYNNTNSALLGKSPAQKGKSGFKRRGKPINGWSQSDRNIGLDYQNWCASWAAQLFPLMKDGASLFIFGARRTVHRVINAFEEGGFLLKDTLAWKKPSAHHRAQRVSVILERRGLTEEAEKWKGWRLGNLAPIWEPIAWFVRPYKIGRTLTDNILANGIGGMNIDECKIDNLSPTNLLEFGFRKDEIKVHEAQKPLGLIEYLIKLTTLENQVVFDPFMGSGTTGVSCKYLNRSFVGIEMNENYFKLAKKRIDEATCLNPVSVV